MKRSIASVVLASVLFLSSCGGGFASQLRVILATSGPLIESLHLGGSKVAVVADFTELGGDAATLADSLNTCGAVKSCNLDAVSRFEFQFKAVDARGHFGLHPKLQTVEGILKGIIASARIYYGGSAPSAGKNASAANGPAPVVTEADLKAQLESLKAAMRP